MDLNKMVLVMIVLGIIQVILHMQQEYFFIFSFSIFLIVEGFMMNGIYFNIYIKVICFVYYFYVLLYYI